MPADSLLSPILPWPLLLLAAAVLLFLVFSTGTPASHLRRSSLEPTTAPGRRAAVGYTAPKPAWVRREVIRLKALLPDHGCRSIALVFARLHQRRRRMTVGKSYVAKVLRESQEEILRMRRHLKHRRPRPVPRNLIWALDLTFLPTPRRSAAVAGLLDHGSRACLSLQPLASRSALALLRVVLDAVHRYGRPRRLRTDNDACFRSWHFRLGLLLFGIRHQRTTPFAPWENGRIERFFGTFKERLRAAREAGHEMPDLALDLDIFRAWYNHLRPHQHLEGRTPAEAWNRTEPRRRGQPRLYQEWNGALRGYG